MTSHQDDHSTKKAPRPATSRRRVSASPSRAPVAAAANGRVGATDSTATTGWNPHEWDALDAHYAHDSFDGGALNPRTGLQNGPWVHNGAAAKGRAKSASGLNGSNGHACPAIGSEPVHRPIIAPVESNAEVPRGEEGTRPATGEDVRDLSTDALFGRCRVPASEARYRWHFDEAITYELLRRACHEQDERARACVKSAFGDMVAASIACYDGWEAAGCDVDELVDIVFDHAWKRLRPEKFEGYPAFKPLLGLFKKTIPYQVVTDELRRHQNHYVVGLPESEDRPVGRQSDGEWEETDPISDEARGQLRAYVLGRAKTKQERVILQHKWFGDRLKPAELLARFPTVFRDSEHVYRTDENLLLRLGRDPELVRLFERILGHSPRRPATR